MRSAAPTLASSRPRAELLTELVSLRVILAKLHEKRCEEPVPAVLAALALADLAIAKAGEA